MADSTASPVAASPVILSEVAVGAGRRIGFARLNAPKSLNALSLDMIRALDTRLQVWGTDDAIACVVLEGAGEKAFCAGGDIRAMYQAMRQNPGNAANPEALTFFGEEYRLDYRIHRYPKPLLVWGSGIVMGGGLGLLAGASHRVVTETSRIAMPEISIGLFPDVGGSWFLPRMPGSTGLFAALTAAPLNGRDALYVGLADHLLAAGQRQALFDRLMTAAWRPDPAANRVLLTQILAEFSAAQLDAPAGNVERHAAFIEAVCAAASLSGVVERIEQYSGEDGWLQRAAQTLRAGSPTTAALIWELRRRSHGMALNEVFRMELIVALQCCAHPDFAEGVRALLIDKDNAPHWTPAALAQVTPHWIAEHFVEPRWPHSVSPLADL